MLAIVFLGLVAACAASPYYRHGPPPFNPDYNHYQRNYNQHHHYDPFGDEIFDTGRFWAELSNDMRQLDQMLSQFYVNFPVISSQQVIDGDKYKITIPLNGFEEKDIVVKAREGLLLVQAVHKMDNGGQSTYLDIKTLPARVNVTGSWTFEGGVLKIVFPLKPEPTEVPVTAAPTLESHSREELESQNVNETKDKDVDVPFRGDQNREVLTNEIPWSSGVEATTYAVDLKDEVELVPVRNYNK